jgi:hypothetical protein
VEIFDIFHRHRELGVILCRARCDVLFDESVDALDESLLFLSEAEVQGVRSLLRLRRRYIHHEGTKITKFGV